MRHETGGSNIYFCPAHDWVFHVGAGTRREIETACSRIKKNNAVSDRTLIATVAGDAKAPTTPATIRRELEGMSPEERNAKLKEYRENLGAKNSRNIKTSRQVSADEWSAFSSKQRARLLQSWQVNPTVGPTLSRAATGTSQAVAGQHGGSGSKPATQAESRNVDATRGRGSETTPGAGKTHEDSPIHSPEFRGRSVVHPSINSN